MPPAADAAYVALVDHAIFRVQKEAIGTLEVEGTPAPGVYETAK